MPTKGNDQDIVSQPRRVTNDDRAVTATMLDEAFARSALDAGEHEQRVASAWAAREAGELAALTSDLPAPGSAELERTRQAADLHEWLAEWRWWLGGAVVMSTIWGVQAIRSGPDFFWPVVPLAIWAAILIAVAIWPRTDDS